MGGVEGTTGMETRVPGLYTAGELAGGANGANRLSGNALPEALVFGERAGEQAARFVSRNKAPDWEQAVAQEQIELIRGTRGRNAGRGPSPALLMSELKELMWRKAGPFRTASVLADALERIRTMRERDLLAAAVSSDSFHNTSLVEWFELRNGLCAAEALALSALNRQESRGAHQRSDFPQPRAEYEINQRIWLERGKLISSIAAVEAQPIVQAARA